MKRITAPDPVARPAQVVAHGNVRVTVLADRLLRIEYASDAVFEDRPSLAVVNRRFPATPFDVRTAGNELIVDTGAVRLRCTDVTLPFTARRLSARIAAGSGSAAWHYGKPDRANLGGTARTLDNWNGNATARAVGFDPETGFVREWDEQRLEPGLLSREGWAVLDDTGTVVLARRGHHDASQPWPVARPDGERIDLYLFAYGTDHRAALRAGAQLLGPQPLPPRYAFGYWYCRYYPYTDRELQALAEQLDNHAIPTDVLVIDMDWHRVGWTGYSWDRDLFPDPTATLARLHDRRMHVAMNLHPADGVGRHEDAFEAMCEAMGLDPAQTDRVPFDITNPSFVDAYFRLLHHPEEDRGVDFWWMDWQQGTETSIAGLDPLAWLNHLHWNDQARRRPTRRPLVFSRWGGLGAGRYPIGFSGDTYATWESLAFQPEFTATAANVLYGYWSHDIGGHFAPGPNAELYTRWVQFGAHSPILRTHGSLNLTNERRFWEYPDPYRTLMIDAVRWRYELVPYLYGGARRAGDVGGSLVRPMYHEHPDLRAAYQAKQQYYLGDDMVVAPVVSPLDDDSQACVRVWLPPGTWYDAARGERIVVERPAGAWHQRRYVLSEVPTFVRAGAVLAGQRGVSRLDAPSYPNLLVTAHPGERGDGELYEDDGVSTGYQRDRCASTPLRHRTSARRRSVRIGPAEGAYRGWLRKRPVEVRFLAEAPPVSVHVGDRELPRAVERTDGHWWYDATSAAVVVALPAVDLRAATTVTVHRAGAQARAAADALLDGFPGMARRIDLVGATTRTLVGDDNRRIIHLTLAADRVATDPSSLVDELGVVRAEVAGLDGVLASHEARWVENESLNPLDAPVASTAIAAARRLLATIAR